MVSTEVNVAGQLLVVLEVLETGLEEVEEEEPELLLDQPAQLSWAETPLAATARAAEVVIFMFKSVVSNVC